jgi:hypothetical protein
MKYLLFLFMFFSSLFVAAQQKSDTTWKKEKEMVTFKIRPKPATGARNPFFPSAAQGLSLIDIFNQYRLTLKPSKDYPKNLQAMLNFTVIKCCVGYAINNMIRDYDNDWETGVFQIRNLYQKQNVVFEKITVRSPSGQYFYIRKVIAVKTG